MTIICLSDYITILFCFWLVCECMKCRLLNVFELNCFRMLLPSLILRTYPDVGYVQPWWFVWSSWLLSCVPLQKLPLLLVIISVVTVWNLCVFIELSRNYIWNVATSFLTCKEAKAGIVKMFILYSLISSSIFVKIVYF